MLAKTRLNPPIFQWLIQLYAIFISLSLIHTIPAWVWYRYILIRYIIFEINFPNWCYLWFLKYIWKLFTHFSKTFNNTYTLLTNKWWITFCSSHCDLFTWGSRITTWILVPKPTQWMITHHALRSRYYFVDILS